MRVLVNEQSAQGARTGVGHYTVQLLRCLRAQAPHDVIESFPGWVEKPPTVWQRLRALVQPDSKAVLDAVPAGSRWASLRAWRIGRAKALARKWPAPAVHFGRRGAFDLYHESNAIPLPTDLPTVVTIHDLSVLLYPEWHPAARVAEWEDHFRRGLAQGRHFLAISEFTRQQLINKIGLPPEQVTRTYMGVRAGMGPMADADVQAVLGRLGLPPRYFLFLGTVEPRKNLLTLLRAYVSLPAQVRDRFPLLLAGGWGWKSDDVAALFHDEGRHRGVISTGYLPEEHLGAVLNGARALVFPSFYEGFGMPPVEMMACGGAVLCSTAEALVETVGGRAHLVDPLDEDGWREALLRVAVDDDWHVELRRGAVAAVRQFTWDRCAAVTLTVYRTVVGRPEHRRPDVLRKTG